MKKLLVLSTFAILLTGCVKPVEVKDEDAQKIVDSFIYKKDKKTGVCYGVMETQRVSSNFSVANNIIVTYVPCSVIPEFQTEKDKLNNSITNTVNDLLK